MKTDLLSVVLAFLAGTGFGFALWGAYRTPVYEPTRLIKTDGAICIAERDDYTGPHWLIRPDGWCYAEDNPVRHGTPMIPKGR